MCFQFTQRLQVVAFIFADPALVNLVQRHRIQVMQLLAPAPDRGDQVRGLQQGQMFSHRLPGHVQMRAELPQGLPIVLVQLIQQRAPALIRQCFEHCIHHATNMQPNGCICQAPFNFYFFMPFLLPQ